MRHAAIPLLESLLRKYEVDYLSVTGRTKAREGALEKVTRKGYTDPKTQLTDLTGIRIIVFLESDVDAASEVIKGNFEIDGKNSLDKSSVLGVDRIGYRSVHFVCSIGERRLQLPEFEDFKGLIFEVQIRTVLQHAWAELAHDRNYKFSGVLPTEIQRELHLHAGLLELADKGFNQLARRIDEYVQVVAKKTEAGELDIEINSPSLQEFFSKKSPELGFTLNSSSVSDLETAIDELHSFGLKIIKDVDSLFSPAFLDAARGSLSETTSLGLSRALMMFSDLDKYLEQSWKGHWSGCFSDTVTLLGKKYGRDSVCTKLRKRNIDVDIDVPDDSDPFSFLEEPGDEEVPF